MARQRTRIGLGSLLLALGLVSGCNSVSETGMAAGGRPPASALTGTVTLDGSSTVLPVSNAMADAFRKDNPNVQISVTGTDTGPGFKRFCAGEIDIADASRPITSAEMADCAAHKVEFYELPVAFDSLTVVVSWSNLLADCLTVAELKKLWEPAAEKTVLRWSQVRPGLPDQPITLFGPSAGSGTYDYFTLAVVGAAGQSRQDYAKVMDLSVAVNGVSGNDNALGFFGYAYYMANRDRLKAVSIDNGKGCVAPSADTVANQTYQPLSRPIFIYVSRAAAARPEVQAFADYYIDPHSARIVRTVGYVPLPAATLLSVGRRLDTGVTGSVFEGRGATLGITADTFQDDDRIKSAIVR